MSPQPVSSDIIRIMLGFVPSCAPAMPAVKHSPASTSAIIDTVPIATVVFLMILVLLFSFFMILVLLFSFLMILVLLFSFLTILVLMLLLFHGRICCRPG